MSKRYSISNIDRNCRRRILLSQGREQIADAPHRLDQARCARVIVQLVPELADQDVYAAVVWTPLAVGDQCEDLIARQRPTGPAGQNGQQFEFIGRQFHGPTAFLGQATPREIQHPTRKLDNVLNATRSAGRFALDHGPAQDAARLLDVMQAHPLGRESAIIGEVVEDEHGFVQMETGFGGSRVVDWLACEQLPRIC